MSSAARQQHTATAGSHPLSLRNLIAQKAVERVLEQDAEHLGGESLVVGVQLLGVHPLALVRHRPVDLSQEVARSKRREEWGREKGSGDER